MALEKHEVALLERIANALERSADADERIATAAETIATYLTAPGPAVSYLFVIGSPAPKS